MLETVLHRDWETWETTRRNLIDSGRGLEGRDGKHAATYSLASLECPDDPTGALLDAIKMAHALVS